MKTQLLRPGFMIALASSMKGGISYETEHEEGSQNQEGLLIQRWETTKTVFDTEEFDRAVKVRGNALYQIRKLCVKTPFCLLCPEPNEEELNEGVRVAQKLCEEFNATSTYTKIRLYVLKARLLGQDEQTAKAIAGEMRSLLSEMGEAIKKMDPEAIREAANKAREVSQMLVVEQQEKVGAAIDLARSAAREMAKTIKKKGKAAIEVATDYRMQMSVLEQAQSVFLDFEEPKQLTSTEEVPPVQVRELDLGEEEENKVVCGSTNEDSLDLAGEIDDGSDKVGNYLKESVRNYQGPA